jgi:hypothetical protein
MWRSSACYYHSWNETNVPKDTRRERWLKRGTAAASQERIGYGDHYRDDQARWTGVSSGSTRVLLYARTRLAKLRRAIRCLDRVCMVHEDTPHYRKRAVALEGERGRLPSGPEWRHGVRISSHRQYTCHPCRYARISYGYQGGLSSGGAGVGARCSYRW